jgi:hypothetical protein
VEVTRETEHKRKKAGNCGNVEVANDNGKNIVVAPKRFLNTFFSSNWTLSEELQF